MADDSRSDAERLATVLAQLFQEASDAAQCCLEVSRLKRDEASAAAFRSILRELQSAAAHVTRIREGLATASAAPPQSDGASR